MTPVRLEPGASRAEVKHSTTEPLRSLARECGLRDAEVQEYGVQSAGRIHDKSIMLDADWAMQNAWLL